MMRQMVSRILLMAMVLLLSAYAMAQDAPAQYRLVFRSGRVVVGEIVQRNDEVVIVKDAYGARFQYPMTDIQEIEELSNKQPESDSEAEETNSRSVTNVKRTSLGVRLVAGRVSLGDHWYGGVLGADVRLGANNLGGRRIFLGGQVGYRVLLFGADARRPSIIPINVALELPLMDGRHAPMIGANAGYGIGLGGVRGGVNAELTLAYRYHFSRTGSLHIGGGIEVQQFASYPHVVYVDDNQPFTSDGGRTALMGLVSFGILF